MAAILDFQNGDYLFLTFCNISASKRPRLLILVSKHTFSGTRNPMGQLKMQYNIMHGIICGEIAYLCNKMTKNPQMNTGVTMEHSSHGTEIL